MIVSNKFVTEKISGGVTTPLLLLCVSLLMRSYHQSEPPCREAVLTMIFFRQTTVSSVFVKLLFWLVWPQEYYDCCRCCWIITPTRPQRIILNLPNDYMSAGTLRRSYISCDFRFDYYFSIRTPRLGTLQIINIDRGGGWVRKSVNGLIGLGSCAIIIIIALMSLLYYTRSVRRPWDPSWFRSRNLDGDYLNYTHMGGGFPNLYYKVRFVKHAHPYFGRKNVKIGVFYETNFVLGERCFRTFRKKHFQLKSLLFHIKYFCTNNK